MAKSGVGGVGRQEPAAALEQLEADFQKVLSDLVGDDNLEQFKTEFDKLHRALKKSYESEKRLAKKVKDLNTEIVANATKVQSALKLSQEDQDTIASLKGEIEQAWKMVDASHEKDGRAKETVGQLKKEISKLSQLVEHGSELSIEQEMQLKELMQERDKILETRDAQEAELAKKRDEASKQMQELQHVEELMSTKQAELQQLKAGLVGRRQEAERETRQQEKLALDMKNATASIELSASNIKDKESAIAAEENSISEMIEEINRQAQCTESLEEDVKNIDSDIQVAQKKVKERHDKYLEQAKINHQKKEEMNRVESALSEAKQSLTKQIDAKNAVAQKVKSLEEKRVLQRRALDTQLMQKDVVERKIEAEKREVESNRKREGEIREQLKQLLVAIDNAKDSTQQQVDLVQLNADMIAKLETDLRLLADQNSTNRNEIRQLDREREMANAKASDTNKKFVKALDEIKVRDMGIDDIQKELRAGETKLKEQQTLYEAARSDRNLYSKNLIEAQDEIAELKRKFKIMNHQIEQLKEEIRQKDHAYVKEHVEHIKAGKEKESLKNDLIRERKRVAASQVEIKRQQVEFEKLNNAINVADAKRLMHKQAYDSAIIRRDELSKELLQENNNIALNHEKHRVLMQTAHQAEHKVREKMESIQALRIKEAQVSRGLHLAKAKGANLDELRKEALSLQSELVANRTKVRAVTEELEDPKNTNRWRKLEGSDPSNYEMMQKLKMLQGRLIKKTEEVVEKDLAIEEKDRVQVELKNILARQPGCDVAEQLSACQQALRDKTKTMKGVASELNMCQVQLGEHKYEMERLTRELQDVKRRYYEHKRKETLLRETDKQQKAGENKRGGLPAAAQDAADKAFDWQEVSDLRYK